VGEIGYFIFLIRLHCIYKVDEIRILYLINKITLYILSGRNKNTLFLLRIYFEYIINYFEKFRSFKKIKKIKRLCTRFLK